jgi:hypothetical protein
MMLYIWHDTLPSLTGTWGHVGRPEKCYLNLTLFCAVLACHDILLLHQQVARSLHSSIAIVANVCMPTAQVIAKMSKMALGWCITLAAMKSGSSGHCCTVVRFCTHGRTNVCTPREALATQTTPTWSSGAIAMLETGLPLNGRTMAPCGIRGVADVFIPRGALTIQIRRPTWCYGPAAVYNASRSCHFSVSYFA